MFTNRFSDSDLRCDFPARESYREALLKRLLSMDESELERVREDMYEAPVIELSDSDLDLIAAAGVGYTDLEAYLNGKGLTQG